MEDTNSEKGETPYMKTFHCLFEQSGTFKNVFKSFGHQAFDYDVLNDYNETDYIIDIFNEIEVAFAYLSGGIEGKEKPNNNLFLKLKPAEDFIMAFFPCTYFCDANELQFRLWGGGKKLELNSESVARLINRNKERAYYFELWIKFCFICTKLKIPTIIENPASNRNYLTSFSPISVSYYEKNRSIFGDNFVKPTNFFAINFDMVETLMMFDYAITNTKQICKIHSTKERSLITEVYASNFYKRFLKSTSQ